MVLFRMRNARFHGHHTPSWGGKYGDVFVLHPPRVLPPWVWARIVHRVAGILWRYRPTASLWVPLPPNLEETCWWARALRQALMGAPVPVAVTPASEFPHPSRFSFPPPTTDRPLPVSTETIDAPEDATSRDILMLLSRTGPAYTAEIASLALVSLITARERLYALHQKGWVIRKRNRYPLWILSRKGTRVALRLLGVPLSVPTPFRRERSGHTSGRHRRTARLWGAWLRKAGYEVLTAWSEVSLPGRKRTTADALAWGRYNNQPVLFWLEVEAGTSSGQRIRRRIQRRLAVAEDWAQEQGLPLIFTVLGRPWAVRAAAQGLRPRQAAVLLAAWTAFGQLPRPDFSGIQEHHSLRTRR